MSLFENNQRLEEFFLITYDRLSSVNKRWWYLLGLTVLCAIPVSLVLNQTFFTIFLANYQPPEIIYQPVKVEQLEVVERKIFKLQTNTYSGFVRIKNVNLHRGIAEQAYTAEFKTVGGTGITKVKGKAFILPSSEKMIVFSRFTTDQEPVELAFTLEKSRFIAEPAFPVINLEVQRKEFRVQDDVFTVSALVRNASAFTLKEINLPVVLYNSNSEILGVNFTLVNDVKSLESRSFQFVWPNRILGVVRAEIFPEINIFQSDVLVNEPSKSPVDPLDELRSRREF